MQEEYQTGAEPVLFIRQILRQSVDTRIPEIAENGAFVVSDRQTLDTYFAGTARRHGRFTHEYLRSQ